MNRLDSNPYPGLTAAQYKQELFKAVWMRYRTLAQAMGPGPLVVLGVLCQGATAAAQGQTSPGCSPVCKSRPAGVMQSVRGRNVRCNICVLLYWEKLILAVSPRCAFLSPFAGL